MKKIFRKNRGGSDSTPPRRWRVKRDYPPCSKLSFIPKLYIKRFSTFHRGHVDHLKKKYCVACKKWTLKVVVNFGFVTSFEDSHYILLLVFLFKTPSCDMSNVVLINEVSEVLQRHYLPSAILLTSLSIFAQLPTLRYFFNEGTAGVLSNT